MFKDFFKAKSFIFHILILAAVSGALYFGNFFNNYGYYDDYKEVVNNKYVDPRQSDAISLFTDIDSFHFYVPLKHITNYILNLAFYFNPHFSHLLSDILHVFNVLLCYLLILRLSGSYRAAFLTALTFAVAPVCSNAVNEIAARGHLFTAFFALSSFYAYTFVDAKGLKHNQDKHFLLLSLFLYIAGLFFWPTVIVLPALLFSYEMLRENRNSIKKIIIRILPFIVAAVIVLIINLYISYIRNRVGNYEAVFDNGMIFFAKLFGWSSFYKMPALLADYIIYCFVPPFFDIIFAPPLPLFMQAPLTYLSKFFVLAAYIAVCVLIYRKNKMMLIAPLIFLFFLLPGMVVMYKTELISLRYMYMASIGVFFAVYAFFEYYIFPYAKEYRKWICVLLIGSFIAASAGNTSARKYSWKNPESVTDSMIKNGGIAEVWGWTLKLNWESNLYYVLVYLNKAKEVLEENKYGYDLQYDLVNQNIVGRIDYINNVLLKNPESEAENIK